MPKFHVTYGVFVGSPSDVSSDVGSIRKIAESVNSHQDRCRFEVKHWGEDALTAFGKGNAQNEIDRQIARSADLFIFLLHARLGTPMENGLTGTEHEFREALKAAKSNKATHVGVFFKTSAIGVDADPDQLKAIQSFKKQISDSGEGIFNEYEDVDELESYVRKLFMSVANNADIAQAQQGAGDGKDIKVAIAMDSIREAVSGTSSEMGVLELQEVFETKVGAAINFLQEFPEKQSKLNQYIDKYVERMPYVDFGSMSLKERAAHIDQVSDEIEDFVRKNSPKVSDYHDNMSSGMEAALLLSEIMPAEKGELEEFLQRVRGTRREMETMYESGLDLVRTIKAMPPMTKKLKSAGRILANLFEEVADATAAGIRLAKSTEQSTEKRIGKQN